MTVKGSSNFYAGSCTMIALVYFLCIWNTESLFFFLLSLLRLLKKISQFYHKSCYIKIWNSLNHHLKFTKFFNISHIFLFRVHLVNFLPHSFHHSYFLLVPQSFLSYSESVNLNARWIRLIGRLYIPRRFGMQTDKRIGRGKSVNKYELHWRNEYLYSHSRLFAVSLVC